MKNISFFLICVGIVFCVPLSVLAVSSSSSSGSSTSAKSCLAQTKLSAKLTQISLVRARQGQKYSEVRINVTKLATNLEKADYDNANIEASLGKYNLKIVDYNKAYADFNAAAVAAKSSICSTDKTVASKNLAAARDKLTVLQQKSQEIKDYLAVIRSDLTEIKKQNIRK